MLKFVYKTKTLVGSQDFVCTKHINNRVERFKISKQTLTKQLIIFYTKGLFNNHKTNIGNKGHFQKINVQTE